MLRQCKGICSLYTLFLSVSFSTLPLLLLVTSQRQTNINRTQTYDFVSYVFLQQQTREIIRASEAMGVFRQPRIHAQGIVTLSNGEPLFFSQSAALLCDRISDAISWAETDFPMTLRVRGVTHSAASATYDACFAFQSTARLSDQIESYLAITRDGMFELTETFPHEHGKRSCLSLTLDAQESLIADEISRFHAAGVRLLIPLSRVSSIYRDSQGTMRLVGNRGSEVIENQPIRERAPLFRFRYGISAAQIPFIELYLKATISTLKEKTIQLPILPQPNNQLSLLAFL